MRKHGRPNFYVVGFGVYEENDSGRGIRRTPAPLEELRKFRFSRIGPLGEPLSDDLLKKVAAAMVPAKDESSDSAIPAGFTYLGQFVDHDLTLDKTAVKLGSQVTVDELVQGRSPALDLDCMYGLGPAKEPQFYSDGVRLKIGTTAGTTFPDRDAVVSQSLDGFDLPRTGVGPDKAARRLANIPDHRNDENLAVAQVHVAFIRFHNAVVDDFAAKGVTGNLFERVRAEVVKHYQAVLRDDLLPKLCDPVVVRDVFAHGRRLFEPAAQAAAAAADAYVPQAPAFGAGTMPIEFSVAAFRIGHSMVRESYSWNRVFHADGPGGPATLERLFQFSGRSGTLSPKGVPSEAPDAFEVLPTNWIADFRRLFVLDEKLEPNRARKLDTRLSPTMAALPPGSFGGLQPQTFGEELQRQLPFRNLVRAKMVQLCTGPQLAAFARERGLLLDPLKPEQLLGKESGANLGALEAQEKEQVVRHTPLWFYLLREAEVHGGGERLGPLGSRIVAETFHRAMESSVYSIVREPLWRPSLGGVSGEPGSFLMADLLRFALGPRGLNPLG